MFGLHVEVIVDDGTDDDETGVGTGGTHGTQFDVLLALW
jgi:hypothetical protein